MKLNELMPSSTNFSKFLVQTKVVTSVFGMAILGGDGGNRDNSVVSIVYLVNT